MSHWTAKKIRALRDAYNETQSDFAKRFRVTPESVRIWEQDRGKPGGPATVLLDQLAQQIAFPVNGDTDGHVTGKSKKKVAVV